MSAAPNPLVGTSLHRCLLALQEAETHLADDTRDDFEVAKRLSDATACTTDAIAIVRGELNRRHAALKQEERGKPAKTPPKMVALKVPGPPGTLPVLFPQTRRGLKEMLDFVAAAMNDGGGAMVAMNHILLDRCRDSGFEQEVGDLRAAAMEALAPADGEG